MIDEDLYQQAADELNSDKRRPHIWARACALASDDHDEARFLYTNLRVEELLEERASSAGTPLSDSTIPENDPTLALSPIQDVPETDETDIEESVSELQLRSDQQDDTTEFLHEMGLGDLSSDDPSHFSSRGGKDGPKNSEDFLQLEPTDENAAQEPSLGLELEEPDADLMSDYVPESAYPLDDTYVPDEELFGQGAVAADTDGDDTAAFVADDNAERSELYKRAAADVHMDSTTDLNALDIEEPLNVLEGTANSSADSTLDLTATLSEGDLTQSNLNVLDAHTSELDDMLVDASYQPITPDEPDTEMEWLDEEEQSLDSDDNTSNTREPVIYEEDPFSEELERQADELDIADTADQTADFSQQIAEELAVDDAFPESEVAASTAVAVSAAAGSAAALASSAETLTSRHSDATGEHLNITGAYDDGLPLDLTEGRKGTLFKVFSFNGKAQAVKSGVSWSALFFTLPYLLYRKLFGTALAYTLLWIVAIGGFIFCALAWRDAGSEVTQFVQAGTIGFALLAFIGLLYLPFRYANTWRSERLENNGYELVAITKAKNKGLAIARARRHAAFDV